MDDKIERTTLVALSNFRFRPVDVEWVEFDVVTPLTKKKQTKLCLRSGKLFILSSDDKDYRMDVDIVIFVTDPTNWICNEFSPDVTQEA